jgi:hypothetical protein
MRELLGIKDDDEKQQQREKTAYVTITPIETANEANSCQ